ncbi:MAG: GH92 family glycosyl hydrolase [Vulcanimicrobiaceae bacterium]
MHASRLARLAIAFAVAVSLASPAIAQQPPQPAATPQPAAPTDPVALVDPMIGTAGDPKSGRVDDFPGPSAPFGMLQWSPDTTEPTPSGGYFYRSNAITGFSLTHLAGAGCTIFGDFGFLPTVGNVDDPAHAQQSFSHDTETSTPGYYSVTVGNPGIKSELTVTKRTGLGAFTFPSTRQANLLVNSSSDQAGVTDAEFHVINPNEIAGSATAGSFCGMPNTFTVYFDAVFDHPMTGHGTWTERAVTPGGSDVTGAGSGGWVTFDTTGGRTIKARVAVSYVSVDGARRNLAAEANTWDLDAIRQATAHAWRSLLGEVQIAGGTPGEQKMFYTSLYHALLSPTLFTDADGSYVGFDKQTRHAEPGHEIYANFSGWDIYRAQATIMALLAPQQASDMMQTLVNDAKQGGWLPKWPVANGYTGVMGGDSADAVIAGAYAFGARSFDMHGALRAMVKGATDPADALGQGYYEERPNLDEYLQRGYVTNVHTSSISPVPNGASETLEYALDDFSIAQFAKNIGDLPTYSRFMKRAQNWTQLMNTAFGLIMPRDGDGGFMQTPITANGQSGFQEGNAAQYTWMVPQGLPWLVAGLGGPRATMQRLDTFFSQLNAGQDQPFAWMGNEPSLASPFTYLYAGAPYREQEVVHRVMTTIYSPTPDSIPGNDDLGTMSAWYVWNAMGLYPINPSVRTLLIGSPIFANVTVHVPQGPTIVVNAPQASDANYYVQNLRINGLNSSKAYVALPTLGTLQLDYVMGAAPNPHWGSAAADMPPSYVSGAPHFPPSTAAALSIPAAPLDLTPASSAPFHLTLSNTAGKAPVRVAWKATLPPGFSLTPSRGLIAANAASESPTTAMLAAKASVAPGLYDIPIASHADNTAPLARVTGVVRVARPGQSVPLAYVANFSDNSVLPFDPRTRAFGTAIPVGTLPGALALSPNGERVYSANQSTNDVSVIDTASQKAVATVKMGKIPAGIGITHDGKTVWVANYGDNTVQSIDAATLKPGPTIPVGQQPEELAISPDGVMLYVVNQGSNTVTPVNTQSGKAETPIPVGDHPLGIAISPDGKTIYVGNQTSSTVSVIDTVSRKNVATITVGKTPENLAISPDGSLVVTADSGSASITPIDTRTNTAKLPIRVGNGPFGAAFSSDGKTIFVVDSGDNQIVPVDVATGKIQTPIPTGSFPISVTTH